MKVFEVTKEYPRCDSTEIVTERRYVTVDGDSILAVVAYFSDLCESTGETLIGVREILVIVQHIKNKTTVVDELTKLSQEMGEYE